MANNYAGSFNSVNVGDFDGTNQQNANTGVDYTSEIATVNQLKDPRFLNDLRETYRARGERVDYLSPDDLIDKFFSDQTWELLNVGSAVKGAYEASQADAEQKARLNRLQQVYNRLPNAWQEGGRGMMDMLGDALPAIALDPTNLVAPLKGMATAGNAARIAATTGRSAMRAGVVQGAKKGAATEALISAGQEGIVNTASQIRDQELGLRDEFSLGELGMATTIGGVTGGVVGGVLGGAGGAYGARNAQNQVDSARFLGLSDGQIARMSDEQAKQAVTEAQKATGPFEPVDVAAARADERAQAEQQAQANEVDPKEEEIKVSFPDAEDKLELAIREAREDVISAGDDGVSEEILAEKRAFRDSVVMLRGMIDRIRAEEDEINKLGATSDPKSQQELRARRAKFEKDLETFQILLKGINKDVDEVEYAAQVQALADRLGYNKATGEAGDAAAEAAPTPTADAETPTPEGAGTAEGVAPNPEAKGEDGTPLDTPADTPAPAKPALTYTTPKVKSEVEELLATNSIDGDMLDEMIQDGRIELDAKGRMTAKSRRQLNTAISKIDAEDGKPVPTADVDPTPVDTPAAPKISAKLRGQALAEGVDYRGLTPSAKAKEGQITGGVLRKAINQRKANPEAAADEYAMQVNKELDELLDDIPDEFTDSDTRGLLEILAGDPNVKSDLEDLLALFDYHATRAAKSEDASSIDIDDASLTKTQQNRLKKRTREIMKEQGLSEDAAVSIARLELVNGMGDAGTPVRGSGESIAEAEKFVTAGRNNKGRIQGFLRRGTPISKGSPYTTTSRVTPTTFGFEEALLKARRKPEAPLTGRKLEQAERKAAQMIAKGMPEERARSLAGLNRGQEKNTGVVEYVTSYGESIRTRNGVRKANKGEIAYADAVTGYAYDSMDFLVEMRDGVPAGRVAPDAPTPTAAPKAPAYEASLAELVKEFGKDPAAMRKGLKALKEAKKLPDGPEPKKPAASKPAMAGDMLVIIREIANPENVRMMSLKQARAGATVADLIGKRNPNPDNWEIKYAPSSTPRDKATLRAVFDTLPDEPTANVDSGARLTDGGVAQPLRGDQLGGKVTGVTPELQKALSFAGVGKGPEYTVADLVFGAKSLESSNWRANVQGHRAIADKIALINAKLAEVAPEGVLLREAKRAESVEQVRSIFSKYSPEELDEAVSFIRALGGDQTNGPRIEGGNGGYSLSTSRSGDTIRQKIKFQFNRHDDRPRIGVLYHEVAHWAYDNILTPAERAQFWELSAKYYDQQGKLNKAALDEFNPMEGYNFHKSPQEFFAYQFEVWATRKRIPGMIQDEGFWGRVAKYVKAVFDRYAFGTKIDPELEPLFSKILPDSERAKVKLGVDSEPKTPLGKQVQKRWVGLTFYKEQLEEAITRDSAEGIIEAHRAFVQEFLLSVAPKRGTEARPNTGIFGPLYKNRNIIAQRIRNIDEIITGKAFKYEGVGQDLVGYRPAWLEEGMDVIDDPIRVADALRDFYERGFASDNPDIGHLTRPAAMKNEEASSVKYLIDRMFLSLETAYKKAEGNGMVAGHTALPDGEKAVRPKASKATRAGKKRNARAAAAMDKEAVGVAKTPAAKRTRNAKANPPQYDPGTAKELKTLSLADLRKEYIQHRGTARGEQIAVEMMAKEKAKPLPAKQVKVSREVLNGRSEDLQQGYLDALYEGNTAKIDEIGYELSRRAANRGRKKAGLPRIEAVIADTSRLIDREISDNTGVSYNDGIPASARASIREMLSFITHRDAEVQTTARTMTYRMLNLMNKTVQGKMDETNVLTTQDIARLAGVDPTTVGTGSFVDLRAPEFKQLRSDMRRLSIGLTKGEASPFDLIHEIGHMITRSGVLKDDEITAIREAYRASSDTVRQRIDSAYGAKYAARLEGKSDNLLAEEWFAEKLAEYMAERVARGDILEAMATGNIAKLKMRNTFDRAIDKMVEFVAYAINGLIGRDSIKQQFRRLTLFGDMFERSARNPLADMTKSGPAIHPSLAVEAVADSVASSPRARLAKIKEFVGTGLSYNGEDRFISFFHGTPNGYAFNRLDNPDVILKPSIRGFYGPGIYLSDNAEVASQVFSRKSTPESMRAQIMEMDISDENKEELIYDALDLHEVRKTISKYRRKMYMAQVEGQDDDIVTSIREMLDDLVEMEAEFTDSLTKAGVKSDPMVIPTFIRVSNPVDFQATAFYSGNDPLIQSVVRHMNMTESSNPRAVNTMVETLGEGATGPDTYKALVRMYMDSGRSKLKAQAELNETLEDLGHDGMLTTHENTVNVDGTDMMNDFETYEGASVSYKGVIVFNPENVKHVEAVDFDELDAGLYHRDMPILPQGEVGSIITEISNESIKDLRSIDAGAYGEALEAGDVDSSLSGAMMSMLRGRSLDAKEEQALRKSGPLGFLMAQSSKMKSLGMHWLGDYYKGHFPDIHQRFAQKYMPLHHMLRELPDSDGALKTWAKRSTGTVAKLQPDSYKRIVRALRRGDGTRQEKALSDQEREVYRAIRTRFQDELKELRASGVMMGNRGPDYFPQVWNKSKIADNRDDFIEKMTRYYKLEATAHGKMSTDEEAKQFAEAIFTKLGTDEADGLYIPAHGGSKNPLSDSVDHGRLIELDKYPAALDMLEDYLEDDLQTMLVKYFEGTSRRLSHIKKFGNNSHGYNDYLKVALEADKGIAKLLSTNREFSVTRQAIDEGGNVSEYELIQTARMPFEGKPTEAKEFAQQLVFAARNGRGQAAIRQMLDSVAPTDSNGNVPLAYQRRADAIVGALTDFKGREQKFQGSDIEFVHNAMNIAMKKPMNGTGSKTAQHISKTIRNFNNISLLGFTTLSSVGDLGLPLIRSGQFRNWIKSLTQFATDPEFRKLIHDTGVAMENIVHERMIYMYGAADNKFSQAFFNATLLTPWTDTNRQIAGAVGYNSFEAMQQKAFKNFNADLGGYANQNADYKRAHRYLSRYGLADFLPDGARQSEMIERGMMKNDDSVRNAVIRFADESIFAPNPDEMPQWTNTPWGGLLSQLKSFPIMMGRLSKYTLDELKQGNAKPFMYLMSMGPAFGAVSLSLKDIIQSRGGDDEKSAELRSRNIAKFLGHDEKVHGNADDFLGWYAESMMMMGGLGLLADVLHSTVTQADNGAYGQQRIASTFLGPSYSLAFQTLPAQLGAVMDDKDSNAKERTAAREIAGRLPILGGVKPIREGIVDAIAGKPDDGKSTKWGSSSGNTYGKKWN